MKQKTKDGLLDYLKNTPMQLDQASAAYLQWIEELEAIECEPEPIEFWTNLYIEGRGSDYPTEILAKDAARPSLIRTIKMREVTD